MYRHRDNSAMFVRRYGRPRTTQPGPRLRSRMEADRVRRYATPSFGSRSIHIYGPTRGQRSTELDKTFLHNFYPGYAQALETDEKHRAQTEDQIRISQDQVAKLETLTVGDLDLHIKANALEHNTSRYHCVQTGDNQPVLRRGQEFAMTVTFSRPYQKEKDDLHFIFETDGKNRAKNLRVTFTLDENKTTPFDGDKDWGARIIAKEGDDDKKLSVSVYIPGNCVVGEWDLKVKTTLVGSQEDYVMVYPKPIAILFNPWSKADNVHYSEDLKLLEEYIMNEAGTVFTGTSDAIGSKSWTYGQFEEGILPICFHLLRKAFAFKMTPAMTDPVEVSRALTRAVNSSDDDGLLAGNWSGDYSGGKSPMSWISSTSILREYAKTGNPVKYGQCWVFSHVLTTVCRALGLPCRSVTNFDSAHDTDNTCTIDNYFDTEGNKLNGGDSVWNFHVWNEVWLLRPDLPPGYDGWHCIDATPQEQSHGVYQCGPCPVSAVKKGEIHIGYDTAFVFSEVNAEVVHWVVEDGDVTKVSSVKKRYVGGHISTKVPDGKPTPNDKHLGFRRQDDTAVRLDITNTYKFPEESPEEREAVKRAVRFTRYGHLLFKDTADLEVEFIGGGQTMVGQDVVSKAKVKNLSKEDKIIAMTMTSRVTRYWDCTVNDEYLAKDKFDEMTLKPGEEKEFQLTIPAKSYMKQCDEGLCFFVYACARDVAKNMPYSAQRPYRLRRPDLTVKGPEKAQSGEAVKVEVSFTNPLPNHTLTHCSFEMSGGMAVAADEKRFDGAFGVHKMKHKDVAPGEKVTIQVKLSQKLAEDEPSPQTYTMNFKFECSEIHCVTGAYTVQLRTQSGSHRPQAQQER